MSNLESILQFTNSLFAKPLLPSEVVNIAISASKMSYKTITNFTIDTANPEYHTIYSKYLIDTYQATRVEGMEYLYDEKHKLYVTTDLFDETGERFLEKEILSLTPKFMSRERSEVCKAFHLMVSDSPMLDLKPSDLVSCTNGLLSGQGKLISHTSLLFANHALGIDYNPKAYDKFVDGYLNERFCEAQYGGDPEQRLIFEELLGGALFDYRDNQKKGLIIFGTSGNTKSKLLDAIARFMGRSFVSTLGLTKIREGEDKQIIQLVGKKINIDQDMYEGT
jgi:phage/plasmid-associated DNA primase